MCVSVCKGTLTYLLHMSKRPLNKAKMFTGKYTPTCLQSKLLSTENEQASCRHQKPATAEIDAYSVSRLDWNERGRMMRGEN